MLNLSFVIICYYLSFVICHLSLSNILRALRGREKKCIAGFQPAKVVLTQKELSRLRCRRDAGATIFSHDPCLRGETGRLCGSAPLSRWASLAGSSFPDLKPHRSRCAGPCEARQGRAFERPRGGR